ncbi:hypothetical protein [Terrabacter carboxydivorans]|uniref:Uncharacterized protein n=1 Tax=Terrabacter carboxydivorans TaxID=619730 RepID=A0ABP5Y0L5_9MICO
MRRALAVATVLAAPLLLAPLATASAGAAQPRIYHTIGSTSASATFSSTTDCQLTEVFVSSSRAMYAAQPGPVGKQGLTAVFVRVTDSCAASGARVAPAAGGGGGPVVFQADVQNGAPLVVDPRLTRASVTTDLTGTDGDGNPVTVHLTASWTGSGPLEHTTDSTHVHFADGNVSSTANDLRRAASAQVSVEVAGRSATGTDPSAVLEQTRSHCIELPRPGVEGFFPCFGFPA